MLVKITLELLLYVPICEKKFVSSVKVVRLKPVRFLNVDQLTACGVLDTEDHKCHRNTNHYISLNI